ncbi:putative trehalose synthase [Bradyrhizobium sp. AZCC 1578]|uniref:hypothetical protein n=1 Tax=Bradyrhizobium sp. AZCC 1578 TaxID=3117027 RepID=UPI002FEFB625
MAQGVDVQIGRDRDDRYRYDRDTTVGVAPTARDVAGVIRSIDYSFMAALHRWGAVEDRQRLYPIFSTWRNWATETFLHAYCKVVRESGLWPDDDAANGVLRFFLLEEAIYEVEYEMSYRPEWLGVPPGGIAKDIGRPLKP